MHSRFIKTPAILFNVDGTLWDFKGAMRSALGESLKALNKHDPLAGGKLNVEKMTEAREDIYQQMRGHITDLNTLREGSISRVLQDASRPNPTLASLLARVYFSHKEKIRALFTDVLFTLKQLAPYYRLGLLSNGNSHAAALGITDLIEFEVFSQNHGGIENPDPRIFEITAMKTGCPIGQLLHVGDLFEIDLLGTLDSGAQSAWLNRNSGEQGPSPVNQISTLAELPGLLGVPQSAFSQHRKKGPRG